MEKIDRTPNQNSKTTKPTSPTHLPEATHFKHLSSLTLTKIKPEKVSHATEAKQFKLKDNTDSKTSTNKLALNLP